MEFQVYIRGKELHQILDELENCVNKVRTTHKLSSLGKTFLSDTYIVPCEIDGNKFFVSIQGETIRGLSERMLKVLYLDTYIYLDYICGTRQKYIKFNVGYNKH